MSAPRRPVHLVPGSACWPGELETIDGPPDELWALGALELLAAPRRLAIVGSRAPTPYGIGQAERFARAFAARGVVVVSGLARGIDTAAHRAALEVGGGTIAVLGSGVDAPWPDGPTTREVAERGLLLSEYAPGTPTRRHHFPLRNRLIAGLSAGVLVVEAAAASGSLITARWAADQGRLVAAVPGRVDHPMAAGCHRLLREGALLAESPADLALELAWKEPAPAPRDRRREDDSPVLRALTGETLTAEEIAARTGIDLERVLADVVRLELEDRVARMPGGLLRRLDGR